MLWAYEGGDACSEVRTFFLDEFPHTAEALHKLWLCPSQNSLGGKGPCKGSNVASAESRVSSGTRAEARDFVHTSVEILVDREEGPGAVLMCSSGRRLAPRRKWMFYYQHWVEQCQNMSHTHAHTHKHLRMEKKFWQREKGATCISVCSWYLHFHLIRLYVNTDYQKNNMAHLWQKLVIFIFIL